MQLGKTKIKTGLCEPTVSNQMRSSNGAGAGGKSSQSQNAELSMQVREPRMDDNRASAADNLRKFLQAAWAVRNFFSTVVSYEKFNFRLFHCVQPTKIITFLLLFRLRRSALTVGRSLTTSATNTSQKKRIRLLLANACQEDEAYHVDIQSVGENEFVRSLIPSSTHSVSMGYKRNAEGDFVWDRTGDAGTFTHWKAGEPNNSGGNEGCAEIHRAEPGGWK